MNLKLHHRDFGKIFLFVRFNAHEYAQTVDPFEIRSPGSMQKFTENRCVLESDIAFCRIRKKSVLLAQFSGAKTGLSSA